MFHPNLELCVAGGNDSERAGEDVLTRRFSPDNSQPEKRRLARH